MLITLFQSLFLLAILGFLLLGFRKYESSLQGNALNSAKAMIPLGSVMLINLAIIMLLSFTFNFESMQSVRSMLFGSMIIWILGLLSGIIFWNQQLDVVQPISARILVPSIGGGLVLFGFSMILNVVWPGAEDLTTNQTLESVSFSVPALVAMLFIVLNAAIAEELIFRLGIQKLLQDWFGPFAAVLLTSLIFMFGHVGMVEPLGFKETQIFLVSVGFCLLRLRYGIYSSLIAHAFFNSAAIIVQIFLVLYQSQGS